MPVGKVFNAAENQVLFNPVSSYYQGKAIRLALENKALANEALQQEVEGYDDAQARAEQKAQREADTARRAEEKHLLEMSQAEQEDVRNANQAGLDIEASGGSPEEQTAAWRAAAEAGPATPDLRDVPADWVFDPERARAQNAVFSSAVKDKNPFAAINPKDYTPASIAEFQRTNDFSVLVRAEGAGGEGRQRDDEIADAEAMLTRMGVPNAHEEAIKKVDGLVKYTADPAGGKMYRTDTIKDTTTEVDIQTPPQGPPPDIQQGETLWALADEATGIGPGAKEFLSKAIGPLGGYTSEATISAKSKFKAAENTLIRAFALNPRYPVAEQNRIKENIEVKPKLWDSPELMHARMVGIRSFLEFERATAEYESKRGGIDRATRTKEENTVADIDRYLRLLGQPPARQGELNQEEQQELDRLRRAAAQ